MPDPVSPASLDSLKIASSVAPSAVASHASSGAVGAVVALAATLEGWQRVAVLCAVLVAIVLLALVMRLRPATSGVAFALLSPSLAYADVVRPGHGSTAIGAGVVLLVLLAIVAVGAGLVWLAFYVADRHRRRELRYAAAVLARASGRTVALLLLLAVPAHALPNLTDVPGAASPPLLAQAAPGAAQAAIDGPAAQPAQPPAMAPAPAPQSPVVPPAAVDPRQPICPEKPATQPPPSTTLGKVEKWLYVAGAVVALASVTAEKLDSIFSGRPSVTP